MKDKIILLFIIIIAAVLRLWNLGSVPLSPDWDEAALGYNAFSIMQTGRDEYGEFLPVVLRSFDDFKPALYAYLTIPFIKLLDLSVTAVRLPSAVFGILTVLAAYFLVLELFSDKKISLLTSFLLAISPWHIQFSRIAFEANVGLALNVFAILFFLKGLNKRIFLYFSTIIMSLNLYVYQSEKVLVPLLLFIFIFLYRKQLLKIKKIFSMAMFLAFLVALPLIIFSFTNKEAFARAKGVSIFSDSILFSASSQKIQRDQANNDKIGLLIDSRKVEYVKKVLDNYLSHYNLNWIFIKGDFENNRHHAPNMGLLYIFELPFLLIGVYVLLFSKLTSGIKTENKALIVLLFLTVPIPASITKDVPHAVRTLHFLPFLQIFIALGIMAFILTVSKIKYQILNIQIKYLIYITSFLFFIFNFLYYANQYFVQLNYYYAKDWQYGYKELVDYIKPKYKNYNKIIVSNIAPLDQSYIFFLFYLKYDPKNYLSQGGTKSGGFKEEGNKFENFEFRKFNYYDEKEKTLLVGSPSDFPEIFKTIKTINYPTGDLAIRVVEKD